MSAGAGIRRFVVAKVLFMHSLLRKAGMGRRLWSISATTVVLTSVTALMGNLLKNGVFTTGKINSTGNRDRRAVDSVRK